jgi:pyruvate,water dikinase
MVEAERYVLRFAEIGHDDIALVGGKNASLGEMHNELSSRGIRVPNGFAITTRAYRRLLANAGIEPALREALRELDFTDTDALDAASRQCRKLIYEADIPGDVREQTLAAFAELAAEYGPALTVAVRSSATAEDLPTASFAGQHDSFLNVEGGDALIEACRRCFASLFTARAIRYRHDKGFDHFSVLLSIAVMKMVRSDLASSGVMFTLDTESGFSDVVLINSAYGLGENVVQGMVDPDEFYIHKPTFEKGYRSVLRRSLGEKKLRMVYAPGRGQPTRNLATARRERLQFSLSDADALQLAGYAIAIEEHFSQRAGHRVPMDIEWAKDGQDGHLYVVQARPETVASARGADTLLEYVLEGERPPVLTSGRAVGSSVASGRARIIRHARDLGLVAPGDVLVADTTAPDWGAAIKTAAALVTNRGGRTCHAAIVARELGIPAVIGCEDATEHIQDGQVVTVSCCEGEQGNVYDGQMSFATHEHDLRQLGRPETQMMVNLGNPGLAFKTAMLPNDGVGLARLEFIISEEVRVHPMALVHPEQIADAAERRQIEALTQGYADPTDYFVDKLAAGVATIGAAVYPKPAIVRLSDFKTNEYAGLLGGAAFEPTEANPMIGFRGASRYAHPNYREGFALECRALKKVRDVMGMTNIKIMVPFCRRVDEARRVLQTMADHGLTRGEDGLEVYVMCEIPNNVIQIDEFSKHFDGFSIGSNDLTQLVLGVDRDSELVAFDFDERDPGVMAMFKLVIEGAHRNGRHVGFCGQAVSDYPEVTRYLVELGIDSVSLTADRLLATTSSIAALEATLTRS